MLDLYLQSNFGVFNTFEKRELWMLSGKDYKDISRLCSNLLNNSWLGQSGRGKHSSNSIRETTTPMVKDQPQPRKYYRMLIIINDTF